MTIFAWIIIGLLIIKFTIKGSLILGAIMAQNSEPSKKTDVKISWISFVIMIATLIFLILYLVL